MTDANTLGRSATFDCLSAILEDENVDMVLWIGGIGASVYFSQTIGISSLMKDVHEKVMQSTEAEEQAGIDMISRKMFECQKPVVFSRLIPKTKADTKAFSALWKRGVPVYPSPRRAAKVLHHLVSYSEYLNVSQ